MKQEAGASLLEALISLLLISIALAATQYLTIVTYSMVATRSKNFHLQLETRRSQMPVLQECEQVDLEYIQIHNCPLSDTILKTVVSYE